MFKKNFISVLSISFLIYPISFFNQLLTSYFLELMKFLIYIGFQCQLYINYYPYSSNKRSYYKRIFFNSKKNILEANKFLSENILCSLFVSLLIGLLLWLFPIYFLKTISGETIKNHDQAI